LHYLDLACTSWEDNQLGLVCFQPLHIGLQTFQGSVLAAMINRNANSWGKLFGNASSLQCKIKDKKINNQNDIKYKQNIKVTIHRFIQCYMHSNFQGL
jgi:hypothetical protein